MDDDIADFDIDDDVMYDVVDDCDCNAAVVLHDEMPVILHYEVVEEVDYVVVVAWYSCTRWLPRLVHCYRSLLDYCGCWHCLGVVAMA